jgi:hypothetical protein
MIPLPKTTGSKRASFVQASYVILDTLVLSAKVIGQSLLDN